MSARAADILGGPYAGLTALPGMDAIDLPIPEWAGEFRVAELLGVGVGVILNGDGNIKNLSFHTRSPDGTMQRFSGRLPDGLDFHMVRADVERLLGNPDGEGGARNVPVLGVRPPWIRYARESYDLVVRFAQDGTIESVQLNSK